MEKKYPIIEVLCEFQFNPGQPWDMTMPGIIYEKIKDDFPLKRQQISIGLGIGIGIEPGKGISGRFGIPPRIQFLNPDESALVQVGPDLLVVNHLKPYPKWETFKNLILKNLEIYIDNVKPIGFKRIGLRYINKIAFEQTSIEISHYFNFYPFIPPQLPQTHESFNIRVEIPYSGGRDRLLLTLATLLPEKPNTIDILLDLDYVLVTPDIIQLGGAAEWIENAHIELTKAYKSCIIERFRNILEEKGNAISSL